MFGYFIITLWIEFNDKLYVTYDKLLHSNCELAYHYYKKELKDTKQKLIAIKCNKLKGLKLDKRIIDGTKIYKKNTRFIKQDLSINSRR